MKWPDPQEQKRGHSETDNNKEHQDVRRPPKKRTSTHDNNGRPAPPERRRVSLDQQQKLEARRASNRRSAQRCRLRQKTVIKKQEMTIRELETDKASMQAMNDTLHKTLDKLLRENHQLWRKMENEVQALLIRNAALQCQLERRIERKED